jgi:hypothetical protein
MIYHVHELFHVYLNIEFAALWRVVEVWRENVSTGCWSRAATVLVNYLDIKGTVSRDKYACS